MMKTLAIASLATLASGGLSVGLASEPVTVVVHPERVVRKVPPGVAGWGAMWNRASLWPAPPDDLATDADHAAYIRRLADAHRPLIQQADVRHLSWPWGVTFSTFGVNWENSAVPWSQRKADCVRGSGWCEKAVVGVGDFVRLAAGWDLEAITVAMPLAVFDGNRERWGPRFFHDDFSDETIEKISGHAARLIEFLKTQPGWKRLQRVYLSAGCEWRRYKLQGRSSAVLTYARLVKRIRERIADDKVWVVACASDSGDMGGAKLAEAVNWNLPLYEELRGTKGTAADLHRYRGSIGLERAADGTTPLTPGNVDRLLRLGVSQRGFLTLNPGPWKGTGDPLPTVLLENAVLGYDSDHRRTSDAPRPWAVTLAHADLVREALAGESLAFLGWTWFPQTIPPEWPFGALRDGRLQPHAVAQAFFSTYHRGAVLPVDVPADSPVRANATRDASGAVLIYGGNFSRLPQQLTLAVRGNHSRSRHRVELLTESGVKRIERPAAVPILLEPECLWRIRVP